MSVAFLITSLVVVATPGTGAVFTISAGLSRGRRASIIAALGCTLGILPHMLAAVIGLAALLNASAVAFQAIKWVGVAYLLFLAWQTARDRSSIETDPGTKSISAWRTIRTAILVNLLNPKLTIFFFAFLPQFVPSQRATGGTVQMIMLSAVFMVLTFVVFTIYGVFAATMRRQVIGRPRVLRWMRRSFAGSYLLLAGRLALESRR